MNPKADPHPPLVSSGFRFAGTLAGLLALAPSLPAQAASAAPPVPEGVQISRLPAVFVENRGQWGGDFLYKTRVGPMTVFLERNGWTFTLVERREKARGPGELLGRRSPPEFESVRGVAVRMQFTGGGPAAPVPEVRANGVQNYFLGNDPSLWRTEIPLFHSVLLHGIRPGVDVHTRIKDGHFEYDLLVSPGVDLATVSIDVEGADRLRLDEHAGLIIETPLGPVRQTLPRAWQIGPTGERQRVQCDLLVIDEFRFGFRAPGWSMERPLVIDPGLIYSGFVGGGSGEQAVAVSLDSTGAATLAGQTLSSDFPATPGAYDPGLSGVSDAFVARLSSSGSALIYATFIGGGNDDAAYAVALDATGAATVAGRTASSNFPATAGAYDTSFNGGLFDGFVVRLDASGSGLTYATLLGGVNDDYVLAVALGTTGAATVVGHTHSPDFPATAGAYDTSMGGESDAFAARLDATGSALSYATFLGGGMQEYAFAVVLDATGAALVAGRTSSSDFPATAGAYDTSFNGGPYDGFVVRLDASGSGLTYATFLGGGSDDLVSDVALSASGAAITAGWTSSSDFPATAGAYDMSFNGGTDAFVARLDTSGSALDYATFLGGGNDDYAYAVALGATGAATVAGETHSADFPATGGSYDTSLNGVSDAFIARLDTIGSGLVYATFLGGGNDDAAYAIALDAAGTATVAGGTGSADFPTTTGVYDASFNGALSDVFVARLQFPYALAIDQPAGNASIRATNSGGTPGNAYLNAVSTITSGIPSGWFFGIDIPVLDLVAEVSAGPPFFGTLDANGAASTTVPGPVPVITVAIVSLEFSGGWTLISATAPFSYTTVP